VPASSLEKHINLLCLCNFLKSDGSIQYLNPKPITACFYSHLNYCCIVIFTRFIILQMILLPPSLPHDLPIPLNQWVATELHETLKNHPQTSYVWPFVQACLFVPWVVLHKFVFFHRIAWTAHGSTGKTKKMDFCFRPACSTIP
jgi:hypothetical protein